MSEKFANNAATTLADSVNTNQTTITVSGVSNFPDSGTFRVVIENEILAVTSVAGTDWEVSRGVEGTTPAIHEAGADVQHVVTAASLVEVVRQNAMKSSGIVTATDGATVTFNLDDGSIHQVTLGGNRTLAVENVTTGQRFMLMIRPEGHTVTWFSGIQWAGGTAPTLTTTAGKTDLFGFLAVGGGVYLGFTCGQNF